MIDRHEFVTPTLQYEAHWTKPPLTYWAAAAGIQLFGCNAWGARFGSGLAFALAAMGVLGAGHALWGKRGGVWAGACFCTMPFTVVAGNVLTTDILLTAWTAMAVWAFARLQSASSRRAERVAGLSFWFFTGLAFLTKGPPALLFLPPLLVWHWRQRPARRLITFGGLAVFVIVGLGWYLLMLRSHPELLRTWVSGELEDRLLSSASHNDEWYKAFYIYVPSLTLGAGGWLWFVVRAGIERKAYRADVLKRYLTSQTPVGWLLLWIVTTLMIFTIAKSKLHLYVLPLSIPFALLLGRYLGNRPGMDGAATRVFLSSWVVLVLLKGGVGLLPHHRDMARLAKACQKAAGSPEVVALTTQDKLNGLQFYLDGKLDRYSASGKMLPYHPAGGRDLVHRIVHADNLDRLVCIVPSDAQSQPLFGILSTHGITVYTNDDCGWCVLTFRRAVLPGQNDKPPEDRSNHATPARR